MTFADDLPPIKSCLSLKYVHYIIPLKVLKSPICAAFRKDDVKFSFLKEKFEIFVVKTKDSYVKVVIYRNPVISDEKPDDGYALKFYTTVTGFNEEPQVSIMKHDDRRAEPVSFFKLSEDILAKISTTHHVFEVFVVTHMLEFKSIDDEHNVNKRRLGVYMSFVKSHLTNKEHKNLCFILKCSQLKDLFTGRLPLSLVAEIIPILTNMSKNSAKVAKYLKARYNGKLTENPDADLNSVLKEVYLVDGNSPVQIAEACMRYMTGQESGLDCIKVIVTDYLTRLLNADYDNILPILDVALLSHDEDLFNKAIFSFLNNFHKVIRSDIYERLSSAKPHVTRLIMHSARVWLTNNDVYIPGWKESDSPAT